MILLADLRLDNSRLQRDLSLVAPCHTIDVRALTLDIAPGQMVVSSVALESPADVRVLRAALQRYRTPGQPYLCVLRDNGANALTQAGTLGATDVLPPGTSREILVETVRRLLDRGQKPDALSSSAMQAGVLLAGMLDAAASGSTIRLSSLETGADLVLDAIRKADIHAWMDTVWTYDDMTYQHCLLVAGLAAAFAGKLRFNERDRRRLVNGALLHDVGKARIPLEILCKPGRLDAEEMAIMRTHPAIGHELLVCQGGFEPELLSVVRHHHEYLDGTGYPDGLAGGEIPDLVRLVTICDIYAAMSEQRPYKPARPPAAAFAVLEEMGGKLDRVLVESFREVMFRG